MKNSKNNIFELIDSLILKEKEMNVRFDERGYPIFEKRMFCNRVPDEILPYRHRNAAKGMKSTAVCFYEPDESLYRRLGNLDSLAIELKSYACFVGFDLSIFSDFLKPFQDFYVLANLVIDMYLILLGNKMVPNLRADEGGGSYFYLFSDAPVVCCGTLGCSLMRDVKKMNKDLIADYAIKHPSQILIQYGPALVKNDNVRSFKAFGWRNKR